jgi:hypothetical protein
MSARQPLGCDWPKWLALDILADAEKAVAIGRQNRTLAVHHFRRATKRWQALLRLMKPYVGTEAVEMAREAKRFAQDVAASHDGQSRIDAFDDLIEAIPAATVFVPPFSDLHRRLVRSKFAVEAKTWPAAYLERLQSWLAAARARVLRWHIEEFSVERLIFRIGKQYRKARRTLPKRWRKAGPAALLDLRNAVVDLELQLQFLVRLRPSAGDDAAKMAHKIQSRLRRLHNTALLEEFVDTSVADKKSRSSLSKPLRRRRRQHRKSAKKAARQLLKRKSKIFTENLRREAARSALASRGARDNRHSRANKTIRMLRMISRGSSGRNPAFSITK